MSVREQCVATTTECLIFKSFFFLGFVALLSSFNLRIQKTPSTPWTWWKCHLAMAHRDIYYFQNEYVPFRVKVTRSNDLYFIYIIQSLTCASVCNTCVLRTSQRLYIPTSYRMVYEYVGTNIVHRVYQEEMEMFCACIFSTLNNCHIYLWYTQLSNRVVDLARVHGSVTVIIIIIAYNFDEHILCVYHIYNICMHFCVYCVRGV